MRWDEIRDECCYRVLLGWGWEMNKLLLVLKKSYFDFYFFFLFSEKYLRINNKSNKKLKTY